MFSRLLILFCSLTLATEAPKALVKPASQDLRDFVAVHCVPLERDISEFAVCPKVEFYRFKDLNLGEAQKFLEKELGLSATAISKKEGTQAIIESLRSHYYAIKAHESDLETQSARQSGKKFEKFVELFEKKLKSHLKNKAIYFDFSTYWAPSVEAKALISIDLKNASIEVVYHGLNDG